MIYTVTQSSTCDRPQLSTQNGTSEATTTIVTENSPSHRTEHSTLDRTTLGIWSDANTTGEQSGKREN